MRRFRFEDPDHLDALLSAERDLDTASFRTNRAGNGGADVKIAPEDIGGLTGDHGVFWTLRNAADEVVYRTACTTVTLD